MPEVIIASLFSLFCFVIIIGKASSKVEIRVRALDDLDTAKIHGNNIQETNNFGD